MGWRDWLGLMPNRDDFARRLMQVAQSRGSVGWTYDRPEAQLRRGENGPRVNLVNLFGEYSHAKPAQRPVLFEKYLTLLLEQGREIPKLWELASKSLYPAVRSRYAALSIEIETRKTAKPFPPVVRWPLTDDLAIVLLYDFGPHMSQVSHEKADVWGQPPEALRERALQNLRALSRPHWEDLNDGAFQIRSEVAYEETFLLVDEVINTLPVAGAPVIGIPNRGVLLAADSNDAQAVRALIARARHSLRHAPWPLSGTLLIRPADGWKRFEAPPDLASPTQALERLSLALTYQEQQSALQKFAERIGDDIYVATFSLLVPKEEPDALISWCSWAQGVVSLLPRTDQIGFTRAPQTPQSETLMRPWAAVERVCGSRMRRTAEDPPRYRVDGFPSDEEWRQLKVAAE